jgi:hypothetical protein
MQSFSPWFEDIEITATKPLPDKPLKVFSLIKSWQGWKIHPSGLKDF